MNLDLTAEQTAIVDTARTFARDEVAPAAAAVDRDNAFPTTLVKRAGALGLNAIVDLVVEALALEEIARASATVAFAVSVNNLVHAVVWRFGSDEQKAGWLKRIASGDAIAAFAHSGSKVWVASATAADVMLVFVPSEDGTTAALSPASAGRLVMTEVETPGVRGLGVREVTLDGARVAADERISAAPGEAVAAWLLARGRLMNAAIANGLSAAALDETIAITRGSPRRKLSQSVQFAIADIATELDASRLLTLKAAAVDHADALNPAEASMAALSATETARRAVDRAVDVMGAAAYRQGTTIDRLMRDVRATQVYLGTADALREVIGEQIVR